MSGQANEWVVWRTGGWIEGVPGLVAGRMGVYADKRAQARDACTYACLRACWRAGERRVGRTAGGRAGELVGGSGWWLLGKVGIV